MTPTFAARPMVGYFLPEKKYLHIAIDRVFAWR
jgi:hypothetical protein